MKTVALFDIADQRFTFYTEAEWDLQIEDWRTELREHLSLEDVDYMNIDDVVEAISGEEYFWEFID